MKKFGLISILAVTLVTCLMAVGCKEKEKNEEKKFVPDELSEYEDKDIGFSIMKPKNVEAVKEGEHTVKFQAPGFPTIVINFEETKQKGEGTGGGASGDGFRWTVSKPLRKLSCEVEGTGEFAEIIEKICKSMKHTKDAPKKPDVVVSNFEAKGDIKDLDKLTKEYEALRPKIKVCWEKAVAKDPKFPSGEVNMNLKYEEDGTLKSSVFTNTFNYKNAKEFMDCIKGLFKEIKPEIEKGDAEIKWQMKFKLFE